MFSAHIPLRRYEKVRNERFSWNLELEAGRVAAVIPLGLVKVVC
jgi:hypothetical protein